MILFFLIILIVGYFIATIKQKDFFHHPEYRYKKSVYGTRYIPQLFAHSPQKQQKQQTQNGFLYSNHQYPLHTFPLRNKRFKTFRPFNSRHE